jgi:cobalt-zinc-cadmium efflux system membrane fusion protein
MAPAVILDTSEDLWVEAQLPASLMGRVRPGDSIKLEDGTAGKVLCVGHSLDPKTRSAKLIGSIPTSAGYVLGQMVTLSTHRRAEVGGLDVPPEAVVWVAGTPSVFVRTEGGFSVLPVKVKGKTLQAATIEADLAPGQKVAVSGLAQLENMIGSE